MNIEEKRNLSQKENRLLIWLLENGNEKSISFIDQIPFLKVHSKCICGCASINFSYNDIEVDLNKNNMEILSDYKWKDQENNLFGIFVFSIDNKIAGIEVWSIDGEKTPTEYPNINSLIKIDSDF